MSILIYVGLGSNVGDARQNVARGLELLLDTHALTNLRASPLYESEPWGGAKGPPFVNAVAEARTSFPPQAVLEVFMRIERAAGRDRSLEPARGAPRTLDLDLLFYGACVLDEPDLVIPHPRAHERRFVLEPLCELNPGLVHPRLQQNARELLAGLADPCTVRRLS
jgi:2-amino-4-hydroxy-6-hydroxymethyldihydropteridine diphosphokinase